MKDMENKGEGNKKKERKLRGGNKRYEKKGIGKKKERRNIKRGK